MLQYHFDQYGLTALYKSVANFATPQKKFL